MAGSANNRDGLAPGSTCSCSQHSQNDIFEMENRLPRIREYLKGASNKMKSGLVFVELANPVQGKEPFTFQHVSTTAV